MKQPGSAWFGLIRAGNNMSVGDLIQYHHTVGVVGLVIGIDHARPGGDIYKILWPHDSRDVRTPTWYVHPDWVEVVQHG
jgi:hypothetical protein